MLQNMPIDSDELFVDERASKPWGTEIDPFLGVWKEEETRGVADGGIVSIEDVVWPMLTEIGKYRETKCSEYVQSKHIDDRMFKFLQVGITLPPTQQMADIKETMELSA